MRERALPRARVNPARQAQSGLFVVGEGVGLERRERTHPLRPGGGRLARDGGGGELALGIAGVLGALFGAPVPGEQAPSAKLSLHAPDRAPQHLAHLAGLQMAEGEPGQRFALLVVRAIDSEEVCVGVEPQIGVRALQDGDRAGLRAADPILRRAQDVERVDGVLEEGGERAEPGAPSRARRRLLRGNYEGFYRADDRGSDPALSSLFDFPTNDPSYTQIGVPQFGYRGDIRYQVRHWARAPCPTTERTN